jgi:hypothetical protein
MRMMALLVAASFVAASLTGSARADITYTYTTDIASGGTGATTNGSYAAASDGTLTVNLYLNETITGGSQTIIGPNGQEKGLFSAGIGINVVGSGSGTITTVALNSNPASNTGTGPNSAGFGNGSNNNSATNVSSDKTNAAILDVTTSTSTTKGTPPNATLISNSGGKQIYQIFLGTVTVSNATGSTQFAVTSFNNSPNTSDFVVINGDSTLTSPTGYVLDLDGQTSNNTNFFGTEDTTTTFTVAAVPEPSSMMLCGLVVCGGAYVAWRRRKAEAIEPTLA